MGLLIHDPIDNWVFFLNNRPTLDRNGLDLTQPLCSRLLLGSPEIQLLLEADSVRNIYLWVGSLHVEGACGLEEAELVAARGEDMVFQFCLKNQVSND